jgi:hypothetical protein
MFSYLITSTYSRFRGRGWLMQTFTVLYYKMFVHTQFTTTEHSLSFRHLFLSRILKSTYTWEWLVGSGEVGVPFMSRFRDGLTQTAKDWSGRESCRTHHAGAETLFICQLALAMHFSPELTSSSDAKCTAMLQQLLTQHNLHLYLQHITVPIACQNRDAWSSIVTSIVWLISRFSIAGTHSRETWVRGTKVESFAFLLLCQPPATTGRQLLSLNSQLLHHLLGLPANNSQRSKGVEYISTDRSNECSW